MMRVSSKTANLNGDDGQRRPAHEIFSTALALWEARYVKKPVPLGGCAIGRCVATHHVFAASVSAQRSSVCRAKRWRSTNEVSRPVYGSTDLAEGARRRVCLLYPCTASGSVESAESVRRHLP